MGDLCEDAQAWADHLSIEDVLLEDQDTNAGENIALTFDLSGSTSPPSADSVVSSWYAEKDTGENCMENYIQMVWKDTKYFCMARSRRQSGGWFMVARYWPKGPKPVTSVQELENNVYPGFQRHCSDQDPPVFSDVAEEGIAAHNAIRASSPHNGNLLLLDQNLCDAAQAWADHLASEDTVAKDKSTDQGENIAVDWSGSVTPPSVDSVVASWYEEKDTGEHCMEHYTQMVWKDTKYFCMARARSLSGGWFMVARYFPKGPSYETSLQEYENNIHHGFKKHCFGQTTKSFSDVAKEGLAVHNQIRGSTPHYGAHLGLDQKLCDDAQAWADLLASEDSMRKDRSTDQGENIAVDWSGSATPPSVDSVVASWYEEKDTGEHCMEHYTQMVWKDTEYFCMARARSLSGAWFMVARYWPKGPREGTSLKKYEDNVFSGFRKLQQSWICTTSTPPRIFSDVAEEALSAHNAIRMSSPHYRNPLVLDQDLCEDAQAWADHLSIEDVVLADQDTNAGENIALAFDLSGSTSPPSADSVVSSWYAEKDTGENCMENYIQMVWKDTKYFCMARSRRQSGGWFMVARYWPKGPSHQTSVQGYENNVYLGFRKLC